VRLAYLGPAGTFSEEALRGAVDVAAHELAPVATVYDAVMAVQHGAVDRALVPIENALEGSVNATLDVLAADAAGVAVVGEIVHPIRHCLVARASLALGEVEAVISHPQAIGQCAQFLRDRLGHARVLAASSTAEAVRLAVGDEPGRLAALGPRLAAELYGGEVLLAGVEDVAGNETRFVWVAGAAAPIHARGPWKTSLVFWGAGAEAPGWLVRCLSEFAFRGVNLTRIESRPRKQGLGRYMFFVDLEGRTDAEAVAEAVAGLRAQAEHVRVLGSYPAAPDRRGGIRPRVSGAG
jgi:prephenate dehydratase